MTAPMPQMTDLNARATAVKLEDGDEPKTRLAKDRMIEDKGPPSSNGEAEEETVCVAAVRPAASSSDEKRHDKASIRKMEDPILRVSESCSNRLRALRHV